MKSPKLRFPKFTDEWSNVQLGELLEFNNGINAGKDSYGKGRKFINVLDILNNEHIIYENIKGSVEVDAKTEKNNKVEYGDLVFLRSSETREDVGKCSVYLDEEEYCLFGGFVIRGKKIAEYDPYFLKLNLETPLIRHQIGSKSGGSTRFNVSQGILNSIDIRMPSIGEQKAISKFMDMFNKKIQLQQQKIDLLQEQKKTFLQKMFPKIEKVYPKVRFGEFSEEWKLYKLSEIFVKGGSGGTPKSTNKTYYDGNIPFLGISDISKSKGFIHDTEKHISDEGLENSAAWIVPSGAISLAMYASVGKLAILNTELATSQAFYNMIFEDDDLRNYVYQRLCKANEFGEWIKLISTGTQANLNADKVKNFEIAIPSNKKEVSKISNLFMRMDKHIILQQYKLNLLKKQKKGFMQQMFI